MKPDRTLIDSDQLPTPEELRAYAIRNDITNAAEILAYLKK